MENTWTKLCICKGKKLAWYLYEKKMTDNKLSYLWIPNYCLSHEIKMNYFNWYHV